MNSIVLTIHVSDGYLTLMNQKRVDLLEAIIKHGSINAAAKHLEISYKHAWDLVDEMNHAFQEPLVLTGKGGHKGGGSTVTKQGCHILNCYRAIVSKSNNAVVKEIQELSMSLQPTNEQYQ